jgi:hypothetical protein
MFESPCDSVLQVPTVKSKSTLGQKLLEAAPISSKTRQHKSKENCIADYTDTLLRKRDKVVASHSIVKGKVLRTEPKILQPAM